jgi:hypothetical protein
VRARARERPPVDMVQRYQAKVKCLRRWRRLILVMVEGEDGLAGRLFGVWEDIVDWDMLVVGVLLVGGMGFSMCSFDALKSCMVVGACGVGFAVSDGVLCWWRWRLRCVHLSQRGMVIMT